MLIGLFKGLIVGIVVSIPVGPLGLLCIPRTLAKGRRAGLAVGLGGSASDTLYSALALFALSFINGFIDAHEVWVLLAGGLIISITGIRLLISRHQVGNPDRITANAMSSVRHAEGLQVRKSLPGLLPLHAEDRIPAAPGRTFRPWQPPFHLCFQHL